MNVVPFDIAARLLLTAVLLTSGSAGGIRHAHSEGDRPHIHEQILEHEHPHPHDGHDHCAHVHEELAGDTEARSTAEISNAIRHLHFSWLGLDFVLPLPTPVSPNESDDDSNLASEIGVVQLVDTFVSTSVVAAAPARFASAVPSPQGSDSLIWDQRMGRFSSAPAVAAGLCDTARHERSGVQLF